MSIFWNPTEAVDLLEMPLPIITEGTQDMGNGVYWLRAGTPLDEYFAVANDEDAKYLVAEDFYFYSNKPDQAKVVPLITAGYIDIDKAEEAAGITYSDDCLVALEKAGIILAAATIALSETQIQDSVDNWLDEHPEATTTVQDGSITKVKLDENLQGKIDEVDDLKSAFVNEHLGNIPLFLVDGEYVDNTNGNFVAYAGWSRSEFIPVKSYYSITGAVSYRSIYNAFYDNNKTFLKSFVIEQTDTVIVVPDDAVYMAVSSTTPAMANIKLTAVSKTEAETAKNSEKTTFSVGSICKASFDKQYTDFYRQNEKVLYVYGGRKYMALKASAGGSAMYVNTIYDGQSVWGLQANFNALNYVVFEPANNGWAYFGSGSASTEAYTGRFAIVDITDYSEQAIASLEKMTFDALGLSFDGEMQFLAKPYLGQIILTYGDSITQQHTWQDAVLEKTGAWKYINLGVGGRRLMTMATDEALATIAAAGNFDVLLVMGGMNDWIQDREIGTIDDTDLGTDAFTGTFYAGLNVLMDKLTTQYPQKLIVFMSPTPAFIGNPDTFFLDAGSGEVNSNGNTLRDFADAMENACKKWHLPFVNLNNLVGWNPNNISSFVTAEASGEYTNYIHPKQAGGARMADWISGSLLNCKIN